MAVGTSGVAGIQNIAIYWLFTAVAMITAAYGGDAVRETLQRRLIVVAWILAVLYAAGLALGGLDAEVFLSRRSFALEALILIAFLVPLAASRSWSTRWLPWTLFALIVASLSRTAMVAAAVLLVVRVSYTRTGMKLLRFVLLMAAALGGMIWAVLDIPVLRERFSGGDQAFQIGGFTLSTEGRNRLWGVVWNDVDSAPVLGHGPGAASAIIRRNIPSQDEPHNDFLRTLYDTGAVGLVLFVAALACLLVATARRARAATTPEGRAPHVGAFLALLALCFALITDNALIYSFVMAPLAVIVGLSVSVAPPARREKIAPAVAQARSIARLARP